MKLVPIAINRKLRRCLMLAAASTFGLLGVTGASAAASTTLSHGHGAFTATTVLEPPDCSIYSAYQATLRFPVPPDAFGTFSGGKVNVTVHSGAQPAAWGEFADGTHPNDPLHCSDPVAPVPNFSGVATGTSRSNQVLACNLGDPTVPPSGTYLRDGNRLGEEGLDITYTFNSVSDAIPGGCLGETAPVTIKTSIALSNTVPWGTKCDSPFAPQTCVLGPARF